MHIAAGVTSLGGKSPQLDHHYSRQLVHLEFLGHIAMLLALATVHSIKTSQKLYLFKGFEALVETGNFVDLFFLCCLFFYNLSTGFYTRVKEICFCFFNNVFSEKLFNRLDHIVLKIDADNYRFEQFLLLFNHAAQGFSVYLTVVHQVAQTGADFYLVREEVVFPTYITDVTFLEL